MRKLAPANRDGMLAAHCSPGSTSILLREIATWIARHLPSERGWSAAVHREADSDTQGYRARHQGG